MKLFLRSLLISLLVSTSILCMKKPFPTLEQLALEKVFQMTWEEVKDIKDTRVITDFLNEDLPDLIPPTPGNYENFLTELINKTVRESSKLSQEEKVELIKYLLSKQKLFYKKNDELVSFVLNIILNTNVFNEDLKLVLINELLKLPNISQQNKSFLTWLKEKYDYQYKITVLPLLLNTVPLLYKAAMSHNPNFIEQLLKYGADPNVILMGAGKLTSIAFLLLNTEETDDEVYKQFVDCLKLLLKAGAADIAVEDRYKGPYYKLIIYRDFQAHRTAATEALASLVKDKNILNKMRVYAENLEQGRKYILTNIIAEHIK